MVSDMERFRETLTMHEDTKSWAQGLLVEPTLEEELALEKDARAILEDDDHEAIALMCSTLIKQNWYQQRIIKQSVEKICELEAKLICYSPIRKWPWWKLFGSN